MAFTQTVTLVRRAKGEPDALGNDTWAETPVDVQAVYAPGSSNETVQGRDSLTVTAIVYLPASTRVDALDAVEVDGQRFEVDGEPITWRHALTGWAPGIEVRLRRSVG